MEFIDGFVAAVKNENKEAYIKHAREMAAVFKEYGALRLTECWEADVPEGKLTSFPMAVMREDGESVVLSWLAWPSKEVRDAGWGKVIADPRMNDENNKPPFDGKRMIYGGFQMVVNE